LSVTLIIPALITIAILSQLLHVYNQMKTTQVSFWHPFYTNVYLLYLLLIQLNSLYAATKQWVCTQFFMKVI